MLKFYFAAIISLGSLTAWAKPNPHFVGWFNTFVPGGGEFLLGNPGLGTLQAGFELSTFLAGYFMSRRQPMTLDGVPESIPDFHLVTVVRSGKKVTVRRNFNADMSKPLYADWLQEIGIKTHFVDVFNAYREAGAHVDQTPTLQLFLKPFDGKTLADPWVFTPIFLSALAVVADYISTVNAGVPTHPHVETYSRVLYGATYMGVFPIGSAAPEEMFYRGFLQTEAYSLVGSPFFSVPVSTAAYALSHSQGVDQLAAAVTGLYLGILTQVKHGELGPGIACHFWGDIFAGLEAVALLIKGDKPLRPVKVGVQFTF